MGNITLNFLSESPANHPHTPQTGRSEITLPYPYPSESLFFQPAAYVCFILAAFNQI